MARLALPEHLTAGCCFSGADRRRGDRRRRRRARRLGYVRRGACRVIRRGWSGLFCRRLRFGGPDRRRRRWRLRGGWRRFGGRFRRRPGLRGRRPL